MMTGAHPFDPQTADELPAVIPVFPLPGALLLPRAILPLNIFEPRYLAMVLDSLGAGRMIGMIQPSEAERDGGKPPLYHTGCLGRISAFQETRDGRILLTMRGICRFHIDEELDGTTPYRQCRVTYRPFVRDLEEQEDPDVPRDVLLPILRNYFQRNNMEVEWTCIEKAPAERLVNYLAMICPFDPCEKQVLLEAATVAERARLLIRFLELAGENEGSGPNRVQ